MSNRDKQIRTLLPLIFDKLCKIDGTYHGLTPDKMLANVEAYNVAEMITDLNYRKESEVAEEVIEHIVHSAIGNLNIDGLDGKFIIIPMHILVEIKEQYAERSNNE